MDARFAANKEATKKFTVIDTTDGSTVAGPFRTKAEAEHEAAASNADHEAEVAKAARKARKAAPVDVVQVDPATMDVSARLLAAKAEAAAKKVWKESGFAGDAPATPVLDWMDATPRSARKSTTAKATTSTRTEDDQKKMVDVILAARAEGLSWAKVAIRLDEAGVPTRSGGPWWDSTAHETARRLGLNTKAA